MSRVSENGALSALIAVSTVGLPGSGHARYASGLLRYGGTGKTEPKSSDCVRWRYRSRMLAVSRSLSVIGVKPVGPM
jgi:hypothetical protein